MKRVCIESPLSGDRERNKFYARLCMQDCLDRGEAPYASHLLFDHPDLLDDESPAERERGMEAGFTWVRVANLAAVYTDLGISRGMAAGIGQARLNLVDVVYRELPPELWKRFATRYPDVVRCEDLGQGGQHG